LAKSTITSVGTTALPANAAAWKAPLANCLHPGLIATVNSQLASRPAGTYSNLRGKCTTNTTNAATTLRFLDNVTNSACVISITAASTGAFEDTTNTEAVTDGTQCHFAYTVATGTTGNATLTQCQIDFEPTDTTKTVTVFGTAGTPSSTTASATYYHAITGQINLLITTPESAVQTQFKKAVTLKNWRVRVITDGRSGSTTYRLRKNAANAAQSVSTSATGTFEDTTNTDSIAVDDKVNIQVVMPAGTQAVSWSATAVNAETTNEGISFLGFVGANSTGGFAQNFNITNYITYAYPLPTTTLANAQYKLYRNAIVGNLTVNVVSNTVNGATTARLNDDGTNIDPQISIGASSSGFFADTTNTATVAANSLICPVFITAGSSGTIAVGSLLHEVRPPPTPVSTTKTHKYNILQKITATKTHKYHVQVKTSTQVVRFQKSTGANGTTQDINLNFTPKAIIVFSANGTADGTNEAYYQESLGFSDGTNMAGYAVASRDAVGPTITGRQHYTGVIWAKMSLTAPHTTVTAYATCAFSNNKVTFTYPINDAEATDITLWAFGGDDITNAKVNTVSIGRNTAGSQDYTGLGFNPSGNGKSALFMLSTGSQTVGANETHALSAFGCATSTIASATAGSNQWYRTQLSEHNVNPSDTWYVSNTDRCFAVLNTTGGFSHWAFLKSWLTDGFQLQWDGPPTATDFDFSYLVINGGTWDSGTLTTLATPTNNVDTTVSVNSKPIRGLMLTGVTQQTGGVINAYNLFSLGATDGTTQSVIAGIDEDNQNPCDNYRYSSNTAIYHTLGTDGANSVRAVFDSFGTNSFRLDYTILPVAHLVHWVVVADPVTVTQVTTTKTHKYNIIQQITKTKTHKYNIITKVTKNAVHVFNIIGKIVRTRTHKYNIIGKITRTRTHKFNILQQITRTRTHKYNILHQVIRTRTHKYNIIGKIVRSSTHKYNIIGKIVRTRTHKYHIEGKVTSSHTHKFNILNKVTTTKTHKYNILHKVTSNKTHVFNVIGKITQQKTHKFNIIARINSQKTHKYNIIGKVVATKTHVYNIIHSIARSATHKYNILERVTKSKTHKFNITSPFEQVVATKTHKFNVISAFEEVTTTKTHKFNILQRVSLTKTHVFSVLSQVVKSKTHKFNVIGKVTRSRTHKFNIIGKVTLSKQHRFAILNKVTLSRTHKFNILAKVTRSKTHKYNIIGKITVNKTHRYNMGGKIVATKTHKYHITGKMVDFYELGGSTHALIKFPERIRIIDIISDLNNRAVANIEVIPNLQENIAVANVAIEKYSHLLTAETQGHKHKIQARSGLILPPIIDTIQNHAYCLIGKELLEPQAKSLNHIKGSLRLQIPANPYLRTSGQTLIAEKPEDVIRVASNTEVASSRHKHRSQSHVMIPYNVKRHRAKSSGEKLVDPEYIKRIKTLIKVIKSDALFGK
jgi:hypothetical protein